MKVEERFDPELRGVAAWLPKLRLGPRMVGLVQRLRTVFSFRKDRVHDGVERRWARAPRADGGAVSLLVYRPVEEVGPRPAILWLHGGGFVLGRPEDDDAHSLSLCKALGVVVVAPVYRLAPTHPYPAALDDALAALEWVHGSALELGLDPERIAVGGRSAGAGLTAGLALAARDLGGPSIAFQLLLYPMLDDRTAEREAGDGRAYPLWSPANNRFGWAAYLRTEDPSRAVSPYAAPARSTSLAGLPRTWLGVGDQDLFHEEDLAYASRLKAEGVACGLHVAQGAFHAFDLVAPRATVSRRFAEAYRVDMADALGVRLDRAPSPDELKRAAV